MMMLGCSTTFSITNLGAQQQLQFKARVEVVAELKFQVEVLRVSEVTDKDSPPTRLVRCEYSINGNSTANSVLLTLRSSASSVSFSMISTALRCRAH
jgi:hypothetical protein